MAKNDLTKKRLIAAYEELDKKIGIDPPIEYDEMSQEDFEQELFDIISDQEMVTENDKFSKVTEATFDLLREKFEEEEPEDDYEEEEEEDEEDEEEEPAPKKGKKAPAPAPAPAPVKGKKAPVVEEEDEEDEEDEEEDEPIPAPKKGKQAPAPKGKKAQVVEEEDEEEDEEDEEESLIDKVKSAKKKVDLTELVKSNVEFKKKRKELLAESSIFTLRKMMLDIIGGNKPSEKTTKKSEKKEERPKVEWPKGFAKGDSVTFTDRKGEKRTGVLEKYFWHKQSQKFWYLIISGGKNFYKHAEDLVAKNKNKK